MSRRYRIKRQREKYREIRMIERYFFRWQVFLCGGLLLLLLAFIVSNYQVYLVYPIPAMILLFFVIIGFSYWFIHIPKWLRKKRDKFIEKTKAYYKYTYKI